MTEDHPRGERPASSAISILSASVLLESDVVAARQRARQIAAHLGFDIHQQTKIATAVSEIARNAYNYGNGGRVEFSVEGAAPPQSLVIRVIDSGRGIANLPSVLEGSYRSQTGMGLGIVGARRLMDAFEIDSPQGRGVTVTMTKALPSRAPLVTKRTLIRMLDDLASQDPPGPLGEMQQQNRELLSVLEELASRQDELVRLNSELEDTNRGVVALYAELDDKADHLRRADEMKSRFLSNMSHEFRTPLNSILALTRLLLDHTEGDLSSEQERQVFFIRKSAESLYELVNDLLDLAKVQAGKTTVHLAEFDVKSLFGALRGVLRPLLVNPSVNLVFDDPEEMPPLVSDEGKVSQILRNFISNALKFTEHGEVRVSARRERGQVIFSVADTGIGIDPSDAERIFQEFTQLESPIQRKVKGTGLGLPLSRRLAELLGGTVAVESSAGVGSTFSLTIPAGEGSGAGAPEEFDTPLEVAGKLPILAVEDDDRTRKLYADYLAGTHYHLISTRSVAQARAALQTVKPRAILLDLTHSVGEAAALLSEIKASKDTRDIPVLVISAVEDPQKVYGQSASVYALKPVSKKWLLESLDRYTRQPGGSRRILLVDDDPTFRYLVKQLFTGMPHEFTEAENGVAGLEAAHEQHPDLIFLDLMMPQMTGYEMLETLRSDPEMREVPVIVVSSRFLNDHDQRQLHGWGAATLSKDRFAHRDLVPAVREILDGFGLADLLPKAG